MNRIDKLSFGAGTLVAMLLTCHAYYSNSHPGSTKISETVFVILFPPSVGLMATENTGRTGQIIAVVALAIANGGLYLLISVLVRKLRGLAEGS